MSNNDTKLFRPNELKTIKRVGKIIVVGTIAVLGISFVTAPQPAPKAPLTQTTEVKTLDPRIAALAQKVQINESHLLAAKAQVSEAPDGVPAYDNEISAYTPSTQIIYIYPSLFNLPEDRQISTLSHEYLHWVWQFKVPDKQALCADLMTYYQRPSVKQRMYPYEKLTVGSPTFCNELHSILGTEVNDSRLSPSLVEWYKQWLPNREALPSYF